MKIKTSITLSRGVLARIDRHAGSESRSSFIERAVQAFLDAEDRGRRDAAELERLNRAAEVLSAEARDVLEYQAPWSDE